MTPSPTTNDRPERLDPASRRELATTLNRTLLWILAPLVALSLLRIVNIGWIPAMGLHLGLLIGLALVHTGRDRLPIWLLGGYPTAMLLLISFVASYNNGPGNATIAISTALIITSAFVFGRVVSWLISGLVTLVHVTLTVAVVFHGFMPPVSQMVIVRSPMQILLEACILLLFPQIAVVSIATLMRVIERARIREQQQEAALRVQTETSEELARLIDTANAPIFGIDTEGRINEWNRTAERLTGLSKSEVMGRGLVDNYIPEDARETVRQVLDDALHGKETANYTLTLANRDQQRITVMLNSTTRRDANGTVIGVVGIGQDVTAQRDAELQLIQASKLASLGEMATGVAHELNQPLNVIRLAASNIKRGIRSGKGGHEYIIEKADRIDQQVTRAATITDHMRMFGRIADEQPEPILPSAFIGGATEMLGEQLRLQQIRIDVETETPETPVLGHQIQLEQVILNLIANARDALLEHRPDQEKWIRLRTATDAAGHEVRITVEDNAGGVPDNVIGKIFEPFVTTKEIGKGTGLGLSVSYGIVRDLNGSLEVRNTEAGACFTIRLPAAG